MARRTAQSDSTTAEAPTSSNATDAAVEAASAGESTDEQGQVNPDGPQAQPVVAFSTGNPTRQYVTGDGWEVGNAAPSDLYLDLEKDEVTAKAPARGQLLALKGSPVEPWVARTLADRNYKG